MVATVKVVTSSDVFSGMVHAVQQVINGTEVTAIMVGTTHFVNALLQRRELAKVCTIRICGPATHSIPPMANWPEDLKETVYEITFKMFFSYHFYTDYLGGWFDSISFWWLFFRWIRNQSIG